ncbi:MAG TPA: hypothetical protein PLX06_05250 [Fimbriimonadaceae bacterium]|nr:hypothetical protein [Fimbriimonadaceae bacterium]
MLHIALAVILSNSAILPDGTEVRVERICEFVNGREFTAWDTQGHRLHVPGKYEKKVLLDDSFPTPENLRKLVIVFSVLPKDPEPGVGPYLHLSPGNWTGTLRLVCTEGPRTCDMGRLGFKKNQTLATFRVTVGPGRYKFFAEEKIGARGILSPFLEKPRHKTTFHMKGRTFEATYVAWTKPRKSEEFGYDVVATLNDGKTIKGLGYHVDGDVIKSGFDVPKGKRIAAIRVSRRPYYQCELGPVALWPRNV